MDVLFPFLLQPLLLAKQLASRSPVFLIEPVSLAASLPADYVAVSLALVPAVPTATVLVTPLLLQMQLAPARSGRTLQPPFSAPVPTLPNVPLRPRAAPLPVPVVTVTTLKLVRTVPLFPAPLQELVRGWLFPRRLPISPLLMLTAPVRFARQPLPPCRQLTIILMTLPKVLP